ncbi:MAG: hypothetical protein ACKOEC_09450 [Acidimicrobiia bacterium]
MPWVACLSLALLFVDAVTAHAQSPRGAIVTFDLAMGSAAVRDRLGSFEPARALAWLKIGADVPSSGVVETIDALTRMAGSNAVVAGIGIESTRPLGRAEIQALSDYAAQASFVSTKFIATDPHDWNTLFAAQGGNPRLITTVYGAAALEQISRVPGLAPAFAAARVPIVHVFARPAGPDEAGQSFWRSVAGFLQSARTAMTILVLDPGGAEGSDWTTAVTGSASVAPEFLYWVGDTDLTRFKPATLTSASLTVWSKQQAGERRRGYDRKTSPAGLYRAMGPSQPAFEALAAMIDRTQEANRRGVYFLADAENNLHTFRFLADVAATTLCRQGGCVGPFAVRGDPPAQSNVLLGPVCSATFLRRAGPTPLDIARPAALETSLFCYACGLPQAPSGRTPPLRLIEF